MSNYNLSFPLFKKPGNPGIFQVVGFLNKLIEKYKKNLKIRKLSVRVARGGGTDFERAKKIFFYLKNHVKYVKDILDIETIQTPIQTLYIGAGDCDDMVLLLGSMLESIGIPVVMVVADYTGRGFSHIYLYAKIKKNKWIALDPAMKKYPGEEHPGARKKIRFIAGSRAAQGKRGFFV